MKILKSPLLYIFAFSLFLHWTSIGTSTMTGPDDPRDYERAVQVSNGEYFPIYGFEINYLTTKDSFVPGGFLYLLMALPHTISDHPYASIYFLGFLASLSAILVYYIARNMRLSTTTTYIAFLLFIANLNVNILSRNLFGANYILFFGTLFLWTLYRSIFTKNSKSEIFLLPLICLAVQIDLANISFLFALLCSFMFFRKRPNLQYQAIGIFIVLLLYMPYILNLFQTDFQDIKKIFSTIGSDLFYEHPQKSLKSIYWLTIFSTPRIIDEFIFGYENFFYKNNLLFTTIQKITYLFGLIILIFPTFQLKKNKTDQSNKIYSTIIFLIIFICSIIFVNLIRLADCQPWYLYSIIPAIVLLQAIGFNALYKMASLPYMKHILQILIVIFITTSLISFKYFLEFNKKNMHGTLKNHLDATKYMKNTSKGNYQIISNMDIEHLHALYMIAKYQDKILPKHPKGKIHFPYNDIGLPFPDKNTSVFYFYEQNLQNEEIIDSTMVENSLKKRTFGNLEVYKLK